MMESLRAETLEEWRAAAVALQGTGLRSLRVWCRFSTSSTESSSTLRELCEGLRSNTSLDEFVAENGDAVSACTSALGEMLRSNTSLREVRLVNGIIQRITMTTLNVERLAEGLRANGSLRRLTLCRWHLKPCDVAVLGRALRTSAPLRMLHRLFDARIGFDATTKVGEALQSKAALEELDLSNRDLPNSPFEHQRGGIPVDLGLLLRHNACLQQLNASFNFVGDRGAAALGQALQVNASLKRLNLQRTGIGFVGAGALRQALQVNASLQTLVLSENRITSEGALALAQALQVNASLQELDLCFNHIGYEGAEAFGQALQMNSSLHTLDLSRNRIGAEGAVALGQALHANALLRRLNLVGCGIGGTGRVALEQAGDRVRLG